MFKPEWKEVIDTCKVDNGKASKLEHFQAIINHLEINNQRFGGGTARRGDQENLQRRIGQFAVCLETPGTLPVTIKD